MRTRTTYIILIIILAASLFVRMDFALHSNAVPDYSDMALYNEAATGDNLIPTSVPPGYPLFLRLVYGIFGSNNYRAVYIIQSIIGTLSVFLIFWIARKTFSERAGLIAAAIAALYPNFICYNCVILTESISLFLLLVILTIYFLPIKEKTRSIIAAIAIFVAYPVKPVFILFSPGLMIALKKRAVFALSLLLLFSPLVIYSMVTGEGSIRAARAFYRSFNEKSVGKLRTKIEETRLGRADLPARVYLKEGLRFIRNNKWGALDIVYNKAEIIVNKGWDSFALEKVTGENRNLQNILTYAYLPVMFLGFLGIFRYTNGQNRVFLLSIGSYLFIIVVFLIFKVRYRLLIEPVLVIFAAAVLDRLCDKTKVLFQKAGEYYKKIGRPDIQRSNPLQAQERSIIRHYRTYWDALLVIVLLAAFLRFYSILQYSSTLDLQDEKIVNELAIKGKFTTTTPPLYPLFVRSVYSIAGRGNQKGVYIAQGIINIITILIVFGVVAELFNKNAAFIAAVICALYPRYIVYSMALDSTTLSVLIVVSLMLVSVISIGERPRSIISAALCASGVLLNPVFVWFIPGTFLISRKKRVFLIFLILFLAPYTIVNLLKFNKLVPVYDTWLYNASAKVYTELKNFWHPIEKLYLNYYILRFKGWDLEQMANADINATFTAAYMYSVIFVLGIIGIFRYYRAEQRNILLPTVFFTATIMLFSDVLKEHKVLVEPLLIVYTSVIMAKALERLTHVPGRIKTMLSKTEYKQTEVNT